MATKVGITGFGRIGRLVFRAMSQDPDFDIVACNITGDTAMAALNTAVQAASAQMYGQGGAQPGAGQGFQGGANAGAGSQQNTNNGSDNKSDDNIQDADFEEVK